MRDLNYQLKQLCYRNRDGSYSTQANRQRILNQLARQLHEMGYRRMSKHVDALVKRWLSEGMAAGTIKNRMNCLRWWAAKVDRRNVIARSNDFYGIPDRQFVSNESKAVEAGQRTQAASTDRGELAGQDAGGAPCGDDLDAAAQKSVQYRHRDLRAL